MWSAIQGGAGTATVTSRRIFIQCSIKFSGPNLTTCESSYTVGE